jgi:hypothetical protein
MTETSRETILSSIATNLPDNTSGEISPADMRNEFVNLADSVPFRHTSSAIPPIVTDDINGTAGNGSFGVGDFWVDSATGSTYICTANTVGAAIWQITATNFPVISDGNGAISQIAVWQDDKIVVGTSALTYTGGVLSVTGTVAATDFTGDGAALTGVASSAQGALADTALQPAAIGVTAQAYSSVLQNTTASYTTAEETKLAGLTELLAIAQSKGITAVAGMVYSASLDKDGGDWIDGAKARASSWFNEPLNTATRGATRAFPDPAVILAEANKVTIYDGTDPALPMWMVFNGGLGRPVYNKTISCVSAKQGVLVIGQLAFGGLAQINFVRDYSYLRSSTTSEFNGCIIANRNVGTADVVTGLLSPLVNSAVNDVTMHCYPNAPIDPATGLQIPTIAVGTDGGVSVINNDGTVTNSGTTVGINTVEFDDRGGLWMTRNNYGRTTLYSTTFAAGFGGSDLTNTMKIPAVSATTNSVLPYGTALLASIGTAFSGLKKFGVSINSVNYSDFSKGMAVFLNSTFNTGWMVGDIKGAFLSSVSTVSLVGSGNISPSLSEFVTVGTGTWVDNGDGSYTFTDTAGGQTRPGVEWATNLMVTDGSKRYGLEYTIVSASNTMAASMFSGGPTIYPNGAGTYTSYGSPTGDGRMRFLIESANTSIGNNFRIRDVKVYEVDADRSVNAKGLIVNGTIARAAVATGAELVGYSGFSAANYLEQPYNADLDFGTGDFSIMGWVKPDATQGAGQDYIFGRDTTELALGYIASTGTWYIYINNVLTTVVRNITGQWGNFALIRSGTTVSLYIDGLLITSSTNAGDVSGTTPTFVIGNLAAGNSQAFEVGSLALLRISATALTAAQIAKIYNDEKHLFQDNALSVLSADAVTALAHDPVTDLLYVGGASGMATISGITPVSRDATAVTTFISVVDEMEIKQ